MARLPYAELDRAHPKVQEAFADLAAPLNIFRMLAHAERNFAPFLRFGGTVLARQQLDDALRELAILYVAAVSKCRYEWTQHVPIAERAGVTSDQVEAIERLDLDAPCFDARERLVLRFTREVVRDVRASDETLAALAGSFPPREIVELLLAIGWYMLVARVLETTGVDLDAPPDRPIAT